MANLDCLCPSVRAVHFNFYYGIVCAFAASAWAVPVVVAPDEKSLRTGKCDFTSSAINYFVCLGLAAILMMCTVRYLFLRFLLYCIKHSEKRQRSNELVECVGALIGRIPRPRLSKMWDDEHHYYRQIIPMNRAKEERRKRKNIKGKVFVKRHIRSFFQEEYNRQASRRNLNHDYNSTGSLDSDIEGDSSDDEALNLECKEYESGRDAHLHGIMSSIFGNDFVSTSRRPDMTRFFGPHVLHPDMKPKKKSGPIKRGAQQCCPSCASCWATEMWKLRFSGSAEGAKWKPKMTNEDRLIYNQVGGFGSGEELIMSSASAVVHALAYLSVLQCEVSWRDAALIPPTMDAQFVLRNFLESCLAHPKVGLPFCYIVSKILVSICDLFRDGSSEFTKPRWDMSLRLSPVAKKLGSGELSGSAMKYSVRNMRSVLSTSDSDLYGACSAWANVGRLEREELLVFRSLARDATNFVAMVENSRRKSRRTRQKFYFTRWTSSMNSVVGTPKRGPGLLRIIRRSIWERSKHLEVEVKEPSIPTGIEVFRNALGHTKKWLKLRLILNSFMESTNERYKQGLSFLPSFARCVPSPVNSPQMLEDGVHLLSECIRHLDQQPRLYLKRGKLFLSLRQLHEAQQDVDRGIEAFMQVTKGSEFLMFNNVGFLKVYGELLRLGAFIAIKRIENVPPPSQEQFIECEEQLKKLEVLRASDPKMSGRSRTHLFVMYFEAARLRACKGLPRSPATNPAPALEVYSDLHENHELLPADLPIATFNKTSQASTVELPASSSQDMHIEERVTGVTHADLQVPGTIKHCCYDQCDQKDREIRQVQWAETLCVTGCDAVCHKKCYRNFKSAYGYLCICCKKHPIDGPALFPTAENADGLRMKRAEISRSNLKQHQDTSVAESTVAFSRRVEKDAGTPSYRHAKPSGTGKFEKKCKEAELASGGLKYCQVCTKDFNSHAQYALHVGSKKHIKRAEKQAERRSALKDARLKTSAELGSVRSSDGVEKPGSEAVPLIERGKIRIRRACDKSVPLSGLPTLEQNEKPMSYSKAVGNVSTFRPFRLNPDATEFSNVAKN